MLHFPVRVITEYFPSILTVQTMMRSDQVVIEYKETYQKNSLRNRCYLASGNGKQMLSVPLLKGKHQQQMIECVAIAYHENWPSKHLKTIATNYNKAPYFDHFFGEIIQILENKPTYLVELNWNILQFLCRSFRWHPSISCSLNYEPMMPGSPSPGSSLRPYPQVFEDRCGFVANLSILDLLFCMGPEKKYIL